MKLKKAYDAVGDAKIKLALAMAEKYPVGSAVYWMHRDHQQKGEVIFTASVRGRFVTDRIRVRNYKTGNTVDIYPCHLCDVW